MNGCAAEVWTRSMSLAMRRLIDEVVLDDDERSLSSTLPALPDPRQAARAV